MIDDTMYKVMETMTQAIQLAAGHNQMRVEKITISINGLGIPRPDQVTFVHDDFYLSELNKQKELARTI